MLALTEIALFHTNAVPVATRKIHQAPESLAIAAGMIGKCSIDSQDGW
jgi:hypothetical protein